LKIPIVNNNLYYIGNNLEYLASNSLSFSLLQLYFLIIHYRASLDSLVEEAGKRELILANTEYAK